eukprot:5836896-Prymnesium_polylepis.1
MAGVRVGLGHFGPKVVTEQPTEQARSASGSLRSQARPRPGGQLRPPLRLRPPRLAHPQPHAMHGLHET